MEVDEYQKQVSKFQRVSSNGSTTSTDNSLNPQKIATDRPNLALQSLGGGEGGGGVARLCGWPSSRIVRVSRASGGKDRHSKVLTSKGLRDRRVRLSVSTAIQFYDLQDRLGYDQPSKAVEWLLKAASSSIDELPSLDPPFPGVMGDYQMVSESNHELNTNNNNTNNGNNGNIVARVKSPGCSSTSETSKGSGLSLSRSENRMRARERAREMASKKEKDKDIDPTRVTVFSPENPSFTDLLTGGINTASRSPMDYFFNRSTQPSPQLIQIPQLQQPQHNYSFLQDTFMPAVATTTGVGGGGGGGGEIHNFNFGMTSSPTGGGVNHPGGFSRGTLQSNLPSSSILPHHQHLQRFQSGSIDGSASTNLPFFIVPNSTVDHYPGTGGYQLNYGGGDGGGGRRGDYHKDKSKN